MAVDSILTVVTAAASQDLITLAVAREELAEPPASKNALIRRDIRQASAAIATYCARVFIAETVTELFRSRGPVFGFLGTGQYIGFLADGGNLPRADEPLILRRYPIISVSSIVEDGVTLEADVDYEIDRERGELRRLWNDIERPWTFEKLLVTYSGGYVPGDVPDDLQDAALRLLTARFKSRGRDPMLRSQNVPGVLEESYWVGATGDNGALPPEVAGLADQFREVRV